MANEHADATTFLELEDAHRGVVQLVGRGLEQLVARVRLEHGDEVARAVATGRETGARDDGVDLLAQQWDVARVRVVRLGCVEPDEPALAAEVAVRVELLDAHVVEVRGTVHCRSRAALGEHERGLVAGSAAQLGGQARDRGAGSSVIAKDPEAHTGHRVEHVRTLRITNRELAIAREHEVIGRHPA